MKSYFQTAHEIYQMMLGNDGLLPFDYHSLAYKDVLKEKTDGLEPSEIVEFQSFMDWFLSRKSRMANIYTANALAHRKEVTNAAPRQEP